MINSSLCILELWIASGSLLETASKAWFKRDRLNKHIIHLTRSIPWYACHSLGSQTIKDIKFLWDMQQSPDCARYAGPHILCSKDRSSNLIYSNFCRFFVILAENLYPTAPRPLFSCIDHTITSRLILSLHRKGQET